MQRKFMYMIGTCTATLNAREWTADSLISKIHVINPLFRNSHPLLIHSLRQVLFIICFIGSNLISASWNRSLVSIYNQCYDDVQIWSQKIGKLVLDKYLPFIF